MVREYLGRTSQIEFYDSTFRFIENSIIISLAFERNIFECNRGDLILDYVPIIRKGTLIF